MKNGQENDHIRNRKNNAMGTSLASFFLPFVLLIKTFIMDQEKKNRSGSQSSDGRKTENVSNRRQSEQPGAPSKSNRQTGGSKRHERDDSNGGADKNTTKKGANSI